MRLGDIFIDFAFRSVAKLGTTWRWALFNSAFGRQLSANLLSNYIAVRYSGESIILGRNDESLSLWPPCQSH